MLLGGSALTFVIKGGTVSLLADAEAKAGPIERPPLSVQAVRRANVVGIDPFLDGCQRLWRRYVRLGACLLGAYAATAVVYLGFVVGGFRLVGNSGVLLGWTVATALASSVLIVWITLVNFFYLLTQMVMAVEDIGVRSGVRRALDFVRSSLREIAGIFGVVLLLAAHRDGRVDRGDRRLRADQPRSASLGLAVLPLQIAAWLVRGFVFQYLALDRARRLSDALPPLRGAPPGHRQRARPGRRTAPRETSRMTTYDRFLSRSAALMQESAIRRMGSVLAQKRDMISFAPGLSGSGNVPVAGTAGDRARAAHGQRRIAFCSTARRAASTAARRHRRHHGATAARRPRSSGCWSPPDRSRGSTSSRACCSIRATSSSSSCRPTPARSPPSATSRPRWWACRRKQDGIRPRRRSTSHSLVAGRAGPASPLPLCRSELSEPDRAADRPRQAAGAARVGGAARPADRRGRPVSRAVLRGLGHRADVRPIRADDDEGRVIYLSSFSKTLAPGFRVAWIDAPAPIAAKLEMAKQAADLLHRQPRSADRLRSLPARHPAAAAADAAPRTTSTSAT